MPNSPTRMKQHIRLSDAPQVQSSSATTPACAASSPPALRLEMMTTKRLRTVLILKGCTRATTAPRQMRWQKSRARTRSSDLARPVTDMPMTTRQQQFANRSKVYLSANDLFFLLLSGTEHRHASTKVW